jgi:hypothetical protein
VLAELTDYDGQWAAIRVRVDEMGITRHELDHHQSGIQEGYAGKLLGPAQIKNLASSRWARRLAQSAANWFSSKILSPRPK